MVLLFTNKEDVHPTAVIPLIEAKGQEVFRLNTEALLTDYEFEWVFDGKSTDFQIRNIQNGLCINGSNVTCIWDRRPEEPSELPVKGNSNVDKHNLEEAGGFLYWLRYYLKNIPSIGSITADRITGSKMLQIKIANEVGFKIPATVFSNRKAAIESLTCRNEHIALKSIENPYIFDEETEQEYVFYTQLVGSSLVKEAPEEAFSQTVTFAQSYVPKDYEVRVTVVGESIFACRINSQEEQSVGKKDWREAELEDLNITAMELPEEISEKCVRFLKQAGLNFGCFDFVVTPKGEYYFLECNPNGQWLWVELITHQKIAEIIAEFLCNPPRV